MNNGLRQDVMLYSRTAPVYVFAASLDVT